MTGITACFVLIEGIDMFLVIENHLRTFQYPKDFGVGDTDLVVRFDPSSVPFFRRARPSTEYTPPNSIKDEEQKTHAYHQKQYLFFIS
jgi:hypothetical protein